MTKLDKTFIENYKNISDYNKQQSLMEAYASTSNYTKQSIRARLVILGVYKNKPKTTKIYKADIVDKLVETMNLKVTDSEYEYLNRLTVTLLRKMLKSYDNSNSKSHFNAKSI